VTGTPNGNDFPLGKTTRYRYSKGFVDDRGNHNLLTITDPKGQTWLDMRYGSGPDFDRAIAFRRGESSYPYTFLSYIPKKPAPSNSFTVLETIVNDPIGNVTE